jgi:GNAT superfamily N-acetyltransferase
MRQVSPSLEAQLAGFFEQLALTTDVHYFSPHPFTREQAHEIATYKGKDLYYVLTAGSGVAAYGMLRGWDEGYARPSLGIAVGRQWRRCGLGRLMMSFLHAAARIRGVSSVRLKVMETNLGAIELYRSLGYQFNTREGEYLVGIVNLGETR